MDWLLIDNSNSRTKFALASETHGPELVGWLPTREISPKTLDESLSKIGWQASVICSVVPDKRQILESWLTQRGPIHILGAHSPIECRIDYPQADQIGADRLANAAGVVSMGKIPAIVIDFGTAVTFDVISSQAAYCGGAIAPGLGAMSAYLPEHTALLPQIEPREPRNAIGKTTEEAMQSGAVYGYRGMVKEILRKLSLEMDGKPHVIATGGDAALISAGVCEIDEVDPMITLQGIRQVALRTFGQENR